MRENNPARRIRRKISGAQETVASRHFPKPLEGSPDVTGEICSVLRDGMTCIPTIAGGHYLAVIMDTGSRRITSWVFGDRYGTELAPGALRMAADRNRILLERSLTATGAPSTVQKLRQNSPKARTDWLHERKRQSCDDALMERLFASFRNELFTGEMLRSPEQTIDAQPVD